jgi:hypothetical protein
MIGRFSSIHGRAGQRDRPAGGRPPAERIQTSVVTGLGLVTLVIGIDNALGTGNIILPLLSVAWA